MLNKTMIFLSLFFVQTSVHARPLDKLIFFGKMSYDVTLFYTNHMITTIAHELGHALVFWFNDVPTRIVINATEKRIKRNRKILREEDKKGWQEKTPLPAFEINPIPSLYSVCIPREQISKKQMILCLFAGPFAGAAASLLLGLVLPAPFFLRTDLSTAFAFNHLANLAPINMFGMKTDGYQIIEQLGVL